MLQQQKEEEETVEDFSKLGTLVDGAETYDNEDVLERGDKILLVDDFLANGRALAGLIDICSQAGASVEGIAVAIEKCFQGGGDELRRQEYRVESLAMIEKMSDDSIEFRS